MNDVFLFIVLIIAVAGLLGIAAWYWGYDSRDGDDRPSQAWIGNPENNHPIVQHHKRGFFKIAKTRV
jgi:nitrogen fixation-related uncharacterized protein